MFRCASSYARLGPRAELMAGRYLHARQGKRAKRESKRLKTFLGRVYRDICRKLEHRSELQDFFVEELSKAEQLLAQERHSKNKLYSLHAPEVECIAKGKAHRKYEFGVKVSVATTNRDNFVVGMFAEHGNPYDGHTLFKALLQVCEITGAAVKRCYVDRGYRGHGIEDTDIFISGRKRDLTPQMKKELKRRSAIEPVIGHMKSNGKLDRNYLAGELGDKINALLCGAGHNDPDHPQEIEGAVTFFCLCIGVEENWPPEPGDHVRLLRMLTGRKWLFSGATTKILESKSHHISTESSLDQNFDKQQWPFQVPKPGWSRSGGLNFSR